MKKVLLVALVMVLVGALLVGCATVPESGAVPAQSAQQSEAVPESAVPESAAADTAPDAAGGKQLIGVSLMTLQYPFFQDIKAGIEEAAGDKYEIVFNDANLDLQSQIDAVENFTTQNVSAIILNAVDSDGIITALDAAAAKNIPVITVDMKPSSGTFATYIGSNNYQGGELAATWAAQYLLEGKDAPNVVVLTNPLSSAAVDRITGFQDKLKELIPGTNVVAEKGADTREEFMSAMEDILISNPEIDVVFAYSAQGGLGANDAIQAAGRGDKISVIGFDATDEEQAEIAKDGSYKASIIQFPKDLGAKCMEYAIKAIAGEKLDEDIPIDVGVYTKDKVYTPDDLGA